MGGEPANEIRIRSGGELAVFRRRFPLQNDYAEKQSRCLCDPSTVADNCFGSNDCGPPHACCSVDDILSRMLFLLLTPSVAWISSTKG